MSADLGKIWKPVVKGGHYPATYFRTRRVARSSERVKEVNRAFTQAAKACKGLQTSDGSFQQCVREKMQGFRARGAPTSRRRRYSNVEYGPLYGE